MKLAAYPPHEQLVFLCARTRMGEEALTQAGRLVTAGLDWEAVWEAARLHSLTPLVAHNLRPLAEWVPRPVRERFVQAYHHNALRHALRAGALGAMLCALHAQGIPVLVLKGTALAYTVYPDPALRVCGDVDLLVQPEDLPAARAALSGIRRDFMLELAADHYDFWVDLPGKWVVAHPDWAGFWRRAVPVEIARAPAWTLAPTDLLLCLCSNCVRRGFSPFKLLVDIAEVVRRYGPAISWEAVQAEARRSGLDRFTWHLFGLARDLLDAPIPAGLLASPADLRLTPLESRLWAYHRDHALSPPPIRSLLTLTSGRPLHRLRALRERLFPPRRWLAWVYGRPADDRRLFLYYLRWPVDLVRRYGHLAPTLLTYRVRDAAGGDRP